MRVWLQFRRHRQHTEPYVGKLACLFFTLSSFPNVNNNGHLLRDLQSGVPVVKRDSIERTSLVTTQLPHGTTGKFFFQTTPKAPNCRFIPFVSLQSSLSCVLLEKQSLLPTASYSFSHFFKLPHIHLQRICLFHYVLFSLLPLTIVTHTVCGRQGKTLQTKADQA